MMSYELDVFFDEVTYTLTYLLYDLSTKDAVVIDPVLDYDQASSIYSFDSIEKLLMVVRQKQLFLRAILETHAHADHLTGSAEIKRRLPHCQVGIGENITAVQKVFAELFDMKDLNTEGEQFDVLLKDDQDVSFGSILVHPIATPGHTPACMSYLIGDRLFTGDALFMPDSGTGRCDFPKGSAEDLYHSIQKLYRLPDETKVFVGHDYMPGGRPLAYESTIGEEKRSNSKLPASLSKEDFILEREKRDLTLSAPKLLLPSIQININAGIFPQTESNGISYLRIPLRPRS